MKFKLLAVSALAMLAPSVASAQSADLTMSGAIVPGACTPALSNGGVINLGRHSASTLNRTAQTELPESDAATLTVTCTVPVVILLAFNDNQAATAVNTLTFSDWPIADAAYKMGLGAVSGTNIGMYGLVDAEASSIDGTPVISLFNGGRPTDSAGWRAASRFWGRYRAVNTVGRFSLGNLGGDGLTGIPLAGLVHTLQFRAAPIIRNGDDLPLAGEIPLAGSISFVVSYM